MFAFVKSADKGATDTLLAELAERATARGLRLAGVVQTNTPRPKSHRCDMDVRVLPRGPVIRISQDLGPQARGCSLDPAALERAVARVQERLDTRTDLLIVNKFGKHEAGGRGFRDTIAQAVLLGVPVLVGLNTLNQADFETFASGEAVALAPRIAALEGWMAAVGVGGARAVA